jgi:hypothetical protein
LFDSAKPAFAESLFDSGLFWIGRIYIYVLSFSLLVRSVARVFAARVAA